MNTVRQTTQFIKCLVAICSGLIAAVSSHAGGGATFTSIGFLQGGAQSRAHGVTPDGLAVAGWGMTPEGSRAFRWTPTGGLENLGVLPGKNNSAAGFISDDGQYIAGRSVISPSTTFSTLWSPHGMQYLGPNLGGEDGNDHALGISGDGQIVVGQAATLVPGDAGYHPYRWTLETGLVTLVSPGEEDITYGAARAASHDGSVIVGWYRQPGTPSQYAFRWTAEEGITPLGDLGLISEARAVSPDGTIIVGDAHVGTRTAFMWTADTGMVNMGNYTHLDAPTPTVPLAVTGDGSIMVGYWMLWGPGWSHIAFIWDKENGFRTLKDALEEDYGLDLTGWTLREAHDISPDGRFIVGFGVNPFGQIEGWIVELTGKPGAPCPGDLTNDGSVGVADLLQLLACWGDVAPGCEAADLTGDGSVGVADLLQLLSAWGPCP